jgi:hypothetical protein
MAKEKVTKEIAELTDTVPDELNAKLMELTGCKLAIVSIDKFDLLDKNARFMRHETFKNLISNIEKIGFQQWPFCLKIGDRFKVLSGNHRVKAGQQAGKTHLPTLYTDRELTNDEQVAIQLSHNAIAGEDDPVILRELWDSIQNVEMKYFSGLDDKTMDDFAKISVPPLSELRLDYRAVTLMFLPDEVDRATKVFDEAVKACGTKHIFLARMSEFDRAMDALAKTSGAHNVQNTATAFCLMLDIFEAHLDELATAWREREKAGTAVPLASIFGADMVPLAVGKKVLRAVETMRDRGQIDGKAMWKSLEKWADSYLAAPSE